MDQQADPISWGPQVNDNNSTHVVVHSSSTVESSGKAVVLRESYIEWVPEDTFAIVVLRVSPIKSPPKVL